MFLKLPEAFRILAMFRNLEQEIVVQLSSSFGVEAGIQKKEIVVLGLPTHLEAATGVYSWWLHLGFKLINFVDSPSCGISISQVICADFSCFSNSCILYGGLC